MNIEMFINKLTEASIQLNNDLSEAFLLNDLKFLLLNIIFNVEKRCSSCFYGAE